MTGPVHPTGPGTHRRDRGQCLLCLAETPRCWTRPECPRADTLFAHHRRAPLYDTVTVGQVAGLTVGAGHALCVLTAEGPRSDNEPRLRGPAESQVRAQTLRAPGPLQADLARKTACSLPNLAELQHPTKHNCH